MTAFTQIKRLPDAGALAAYADSIGADLPVDPAYDPSGPMSTAFTAVDGSAGERVVGNRWTVLPMEGWDAEPDGSPSDLVRRRWRRFGASGAKLIWGGEAAAVHPDGRANPRQLVVDPTTVAALGALRAELVGTHREHFGRVDDLLVGLQLTHSGRWSRPHGEPAPRVAHRDPILDPRVGAGDESVLTDDELDALVARFVDAGRLAADAGFDFVDVKHCHGYLLHELLSAEDRPGRYGGPLERRLGFLSSVVEGLRTARPELGVGVRLSAYDVVPFVAGPDGRGRPTDGAAGRRPFGAAADGLGVDLADTHSVLDRCRELGIGLVSITAGSPYYTPHIQRPAYFPPSDGYAPPEDPLSGVSRMIGAAAELSVAHPDLAVVGGGYSYLQDFVGNVAQAVVRTGGATSVGLGRMMLSYPDLPADLMGGAEIDRRRICRTFSDCTTAPRHGMISGCYPLDEYYREMPGRIELAAIKRGTRRSVR